MFVIHSLRMTRGRKKEQRRAEKLKERERDKVKTPRKSAAIPARREKKQRAEKPVTKTWYKLIQDVFSGNRRTVHPFFLLLIKNLS